MPIGTAWGARPDCLQQPGHAPQCVEKMRNPGYHCFMDYNTEKVDEMALALLFLTSFDDHGITRAWKGIAWDVSNRLYEKGNIHDPKNRNKSVVFTEKGDKLCRELFTKHFGPDSSGNG